MAQTAAHLWAGWRGSFQFMQRLAELGQVGTGERDVVKSIAALRMMMITADRMREGWSNDVMTVLMVMEGTHPSVLTAPDTTDAVEALMQEYMDLFAELVGKPLAAGEDGP